MAARLVIAESAYTLSQQRSGQWVELSVLRGGADALLGRGNAASEAVLEAAIERSEDWLQPHAKLLRGETLEVVDETDRLPQGLSLLSVTARHWTLAQMEDLFLQLVHVATGRNAHPLALRSSRAFLADVVLLRELAHHAQVAQVRLL